MQFAIFGAGGIGGYLGARLADEGHLVSLIARGEHLEALQSDGLQVESPKGDTHVHLPATEKTAEIGPVDYVFFTVKSNDTRSAATDLNPLLHDDTAVITFQNGVDNEQWLAEEVGSEHVASGVAYIFSTIASPGMINHTDGPDRFVYGELYRENGGRMKRLDDALSACTGLESVLMDDIRTELWEKFAFICALAGLTAAARLPVGDIRETEPTKEMYRDVLDEVVTVARSEGVELERGVVDEWVAFAEDLPADSTSSLYYDLTHEKSMELEALHGSLVRHAEKEDIAVPMTRAIYSLLKPWQERFSE